MQDRFGPFTPIGIPSDIGLSGQYREPSVYSAMKLLRERRDGWWG